MENKLQLLMCLAEFLLYTGVLVFLIVMRKKNAFWTAKLSIKVTKIFAGLKVLGELCMAGLFLAMEQNLFQLPQEQSFKLVSWSSTVVDGLDGIYMIAILLLTLMYLGKVQPAGKKQ